ncbi:MAG: metallophosphoesterase [Deltaproteobacteria bacterium]|nr:metallophosphoesterase [Deltaproteobacteria bacterium]
MSTESQNRRLLVVSDMHLGRDCKEITGFIRNVRPDQEFDRAFTDMLDLYTLGKEREWRLVLAGDFIDFVEVVVAPAKQGPLDLILSFEVTEEERAFGLGSEAERALYKLEKTFEYHQDFFVRLGRFVRDGGEVVVLRGNHDAEFHWKKVQRVFRRTLADLAFRGLQLDVDETLDRREEFQSRISFAPWIYYEPGRVYIEHGHQYDVYCSFDHQLYPISPTDPKRIDTPLFAFAMRYFVNMLTDFAASNADVWTAKDYLNWLSKKGPAGLLYTARMGLGASLRLLLYAGHFTLGRVRRYGKEHAKNLAEEAARFSLPVEKLSQVDQLHHTPVNRNLSELMRLLFLDRILLAAGALTMVMLVLLVAENPWWELAGIVATGLVAWQINRKLQPRRFFVPGPKQAQAAKKIGDLLDVPLVVMGHSHSRRLTDIGSGRRYMNTGCWLPPLPGADHKDPTQPCSCKLSHLVIDQTAELRVFCKAAKTVRIADLDVTKPSVGDSEVDPMHSVDMAVSGSR